MFSKLDHIKLDEIDWEMMVRSKSFWFGYSLFKLAEEDERKSLTELFTKEKAFYNSLTAVEIHMILRNRILARRLEDKSYLKYEEDLFNKL